MPVWGVSQAELESPTRDDVQARRLLQCAQGAFQKWPEGFAGFSAAIHCRDGETVVDGEARVLTGGCVEIRLAHDTLAAWAERALGAISLARTPRFFKDGDGRFPVTWGPDDRHPLGRGVRVHLPGTGWRVYRIDPKGRIRQHENVEPTTRATATYEDFMRACPGRVLPTRIQILNWDVMTRTVVETADIEDAYERHAHVWLPVKRRARLMYAGARREVSLELSGLEMI
jgi:hypothetical protein